MQPQPGNRHGVFFTHACEAISYHYERSPTDPRIAHALTLEVDEFGNVLKEATVGYGRRENILVVNEQGAIEAIPNPGLDHLSPPDRLKQTTRLITYTENTVTNASEVADEYRTPLPCETRTYELTNYTPTGAAGRFQIADFVQPDPNDSNGLALIHIFDNEIDYEVKSTGGKQRRLVEHIRTLYRKNNLTSLLPLGAVESMALPGISYKLAFTPGLLGQIYTRQLDSAPEENLLPTPAQVLGGMNGDQGGYQSSQQLRSQTLFPTDTDHPLWTTSDTVDHWWIPSGRTFYSVIANVADPASTAVAELVEARQHYFLPRKFSDPFDHSSTVDYDTHKLLVIKTEDAVQNLVTVRNDYRVLQPSQMTDPNGNRSEVAFDTLGMVAGTAATAKDGQNLGDTLSGFDANPTPAAIDEFYDANDPHGPAPNLLKGGTTRIIYDLDRFRRTQEAHPQDPTLWLPAYAATLARETHVSDPLPPDGLKIQISFSYSDGFGREIQKKVQAEPGPLIEGGPVVSSRWVGSGWTIFNNKGKPVRQYEPFFSQLAEKRHQFEFGVQVGVSPILFYDPVERVVATLHPNHTYDKVVFDPWRQETWDVNDTTTLEPGNDEYTKGFLLNPNGTPRLPTDDYLPTWHALRTDPANTAEANQKWPDPKIRNAEKIAAEQTAMHAKTPTIAQFDSLGRTFLTVAHNKFKGSDTPSADPPTEEFYSTRTIFDIEGNQREVFDAKDRIVMRYDYDMLGTRIHQASMEAGERWMLNDVAGKLIRAWVLYPPIRERAGRGRRGVGDSSTGAANGGDGDDHLDRRCAECRQGSDHCRVGPGDP